jgi:hypothetical protein
LLASLAHCISKGTAEQIKRLQEALAASLRSSPGLPAETPQPRVISDNTALTQPAPSAVITQPAPSAVITQPAPSAVVTQQFPTSGVTLQWQVVLSSQLQSPALLSSSTENWIERAKPSLELRVGRRKAEAILQVVNRLRTPSEKPDPEEFWSAQDGILDRFHGSHHFTRVIRCLQESRRRTSNSKYAERFLSLFYAHGIDELVRSPVVLGHPRQGVSRLTLAFEAVAAMTETKASDVAIEYRGGKKYKRLIAIGGLGFILQLDIEDDPK